MVVSLVPEPVLRRELNQQMTEQRGFTVHRQMGVTVGPHICKGLFTAIRQCGEIQLFTGGNIHRP